MRLLLLLAACLLLAAACDTADPAMGEGGGPMKCDWGLVSSVIASSGTTTATASSDAASSSSTSAGGDGGASSSASSGAGEGGAPVPGCCGPTTLVEASAPVPAGEEAALVVACPQGAATVAGGCRWGLVAGGVFPTESRPTADGWRCGGASNGDEDETMTAFALCAGGPT